MPHDQSRAELPVLPIRVSLASGSAVVGLLALAVVIALSEDSSAAAFMGLFFAVFWGVTMWLFLRRQWRDQLGRLAAATPAVGEEPAKRAVRRGLCMVVVLAVVEVVVYWLLAPVLGLDASSVAPIAAGALLGTAIWVGLESRDLRRWQAHHGQVVWTRLGARKWAWTKAQARAGLVVVETPAAGQEI